ncbi:MAG: hypothetical protein QOJ29_891 [Thermoleophilaceae bacterium]|jgi:hypothetical protein|nr:hypothetical protein [Thermoleophilaceae bacterium]
MARNQFVDPKTSETYEWYRNHVSEQAYEQQRSINFSARTGSGAGVVRLQGETTPPYLRLVGVIFTQEQLDAFREFYDLSESQTIQFIDGPTGATYEVQITRLTTTRRGVLHNVHDVDNAPTWVWDYEMDLLTY